MKKFLASSMEEALEKVKRDLGEEAYILSQKKVPAPGPLQLGRPDMIEVTAAVDVDRGDHATISADLLTRRYRAAAPPDAVTEGDRRRTPPLLPSLRPVPEAKGIRTDASEPDARLRQDIDPLKAELKALRRLMEQNPLTPMADAQGFQGDFLDLYLLLLDRGLARPTARRLIDALQVQSGTEGIRGRQRLERMLFSLVTALVGHPRPLALEKGKRRVMLAMGPTGVGKTTTLAKLAAYFSLMEGLPTALISTDGFRIGADAQLRTYAEIMDVPYCSVQDADDLKRRLSQWHDRSLILVDTTGRSARDEVGLSQLQPILEAVPPAERQVMLLASATTKTTDLLLVFEQYRRFAPDAWLFTKLDETTSCGTILEVQMQTRIPLSYFSTGQRVPEDVEIAYPRKLARWMLAREEVPWGEE